MLLNKRFSPSNEELCSKPDLKLALEKIREIKQQYLQAHPEEAPDRVSLYFAGAVAEEYISPIKNVFPRTRTKTRRNSYTHFLAKSLLGKSSKTPRVMKKIAKEYETVKANNEEFAQLKKEADEYNKAASTRPVNLARTLQQQAMKALVRQADWLLDEFNTHTVFIWATHNPDALDRPKFYASSEVGKVFEKQLYEALKKQAASGVFQRLVNALGQKAAGILKEKTPHDALLETLQVDSIESISSEKFKTKKRTALAKCISGMVLELIRLHPKHASDDQVMWMNLISSKPSASMPTLTLVNWPRFPNDVISGRYQLHKFDIQTMKQLAIGLRDGQIKVELSPPSSSTDLCLSPAASVATSVSFSPVAAEVASLAPSPVVSSSSSTLPSSFDAMAE